MTLSLISNFHSIRRNADNRTADPADPAAREARLDRLAERLEARERDLDRREALLVQHENPAPSAPPAPTLLHPPRTGGATATLAQQIIAAGQKRRGELIDEEPEPKGLAGDILRAGMLRRGELVEDHKPRTEAEVVAAQIIEAGRRRRGEI
jgi:hypothetical protein